MIKVGWNSFLESMRSPGLSDPVTALAEQNAAVQRAEEERRAVERLSTVERENRAKEKELDAKKREIAMRAQLMSSLK